MSKNEIDDFSDGSIAEIAKSVRTLRWQVQNVQELVTRLGRHRPTHEIRTGRMKAKTGQTYPVSGCVLPVQFQDVGFTEDIGQCDPITRAPWPQKFVSARAYDGKYITEDTDVLIVKVAAKQGRRWFIIPLGMAEATIAFTLTTDRTRETVGGLSIGHANALITDKVGTAGDGVGATVEVIFADKRWYGAVTGCQGIADYIYGPPTSQSSLSRPSGVCSGGYSEWTWDTASRSWSMWADGNHCGEGCSPTPPDGIPTDPTQPSDGIGGCSGGQSQSQNTSGFWIVKECQELSAGFWFQTLEDRQGAGDQDVLVEVQQLCGHANADLPPWLWAGTSGTQSCSGNAEWTMGPGGWVNTIPCGQGCKSLHDPRELLFAPPPFQGDSFLSPCVSDVAPGSATVKVRYRAGTFPRMVAGAIGFATFDNDILNTTDNTTMRYYVVESQELVDAISGDLPANACKVDFAVSSVQNDSPWPHNQPIPASMLPLTIHNNRHAGLGGDSWAATWSDAEQAYVCIDMEKHEVTMSEISSAVVNGCTTISATNRQAYVELCSAAGQPAALLSYKTQAVTNVTGLRLAKNQTGSGAQTSCTPQLVVDFDRYTALVICAAGTPGTVDLDLLSKSMIVDFDCADGCPSALEQKVIVIGVCGDATLVECECEPCPAESGSGS